VVCEKDQKTYQSSVLDLLVISQLLLTDLLTSVSQFLGLEGNLSIQKKKTEIKFLVFWFSERILISDLKLRYNLHLTFSKGGKH